jgi:hypothetical protein
MLPEAGLAACTLVRANTKQAVKHKNLMQESAKLGLNATLSTFIAPPPVVHANAFDDDHQA